ncbi:hypothetical protein Sjap_006847 [Stephania japonica]|uniref:ABC transporter domain-containing protein n=1 Tax=Stephania japonica TaxID=461633 RepID=A0AAP0K8F1_9MAGN
MNVEKYREMIKACCLESDLEMMELRDQTEIGERGISLSGGQKQQIQLTRAIYQDRDMFLIDDVFSAVDTHTGSELFKECVRGALKGKTILLATYQIDFLHNADLILASTDQTNVDLLLPFFVSLSVATLFIVIGVLIIICQVAWPTIFLIIPLGRTGSSKSTLIQAFFRMMEPAGGRIVIDGIDISKIASFLKNQSFSKELLEATSIQLDCIRMKGCGKSFGGQWTQLECRTEATSLPRKSDVKAHSRILFMDEATASVDSQTDGVIQKIIREDFAACTIISIAHRIPTVMVHGLS